jgi:hypothetical protein
LKADFDKRDDSINMLTRKIKAFQEYHSQLTSIIERANQIQMARMTN